MTDLEIDFGVLSDPEQQPRFGRQKILVRLIEVAILPDAAAAARAYGAPYRLQPCPFDMVPVPCFVRAAAS